MAVTQKNELDERRLLGRRIRRRRLSLKKTQAALAASLGITYQQLQKYENGANRVPEDRLQKIACLLDMPVEYFSADNFLPVRAADALERFIESPEGIAVNRAIAGISGAARSRLVMAIAAYCDSRAGPEGSDVATLAAWLKEISSDKGGAQFDRDAREIIRETKVRLARIFGKTVRDNRMTQLFAAQMLRTDQAKISTLARGNIRGVSLEKLLRLLVLLGWDVVIQLAARQADQRGKIEIVLGDS